MGFSRENLGVGCHALLQGIFPTQVSCIGRWILYHLSRSQTEKKVGVTKQEADLTPDQPDPAFYRGAVSH